MNKKESKLKQIANSQQNTKSVFDKAMFKGIANNTGLIPKTNEYTLVTIELGSLNIEHVEYSPFLYDSIKTGRLVNPIILSYEYELREKAGREYREKTGRYNIIDGKKRAVVYDRLFNEAAHDSNDDDMKKYASIPALLLPLNITDEELKKIKTVAEKDKSVSTKEVIKDITKTKNQEITYCYRYEMAEIELDKIVERDNKYKFSPSEVDELEKSIYHAGLMQPIILLPTINTRTMEVEYEIEAGHKRTTAIKQLIKHAKEGKYDNSEFILSAYKTVPSLLIPMGATKEQVEKVYNDTNILTRHMSTDDMFEHIKFFEDLPSRPTTKIEFVAFREKQYRMEKLANVLQEKFKRLGFNDWKNRQTKTFLNVYYYGSDLCLNMFSNLSEHNLTRKELEWIAITNKDFNERKTQDEIIEKSLNDKTYLIQIQEEKTIKRTPQKIKIRKITENILRQKSAFDKMVITPFDLDKANKEDIKNAQKSLTTLEKSIKEMKERLAKVNIEKAAE